MCQTSRRRASFNNHLLTKNTTPKKPMTFFLPQKLALMLCLSERKGTIKLKRQRVDSSETNMNETEHTKTIAEFCSSVSSLRIKLKHLN